MRKRPLLAALALLLLVLAAGCNPLTGGGRANDGTTCVDYTYNVDTPPTATTVVPVTAWPCPTAAPSTVPPTSGTTTTTVPPTTVTSSTPTTTTTATTTPPPVAGWANADNTGPRVAPGPAGRCNTVAGDGARLIGRTCTDYVHVWGDDVLISDSVFLGGLIIEDPADRVTVEYSDITNGLSIASVRGATIRYTDIHGGSDLMHLTSDRGFKATDILIDTVWAHDPTAQLPSHVDGIQVRGVDRLTIRNSAFDLGTWTDSENGAVFLENANGGNNQVLLDRNYLNGGGYILRVGTGGHPGLQIIGNRFGPVAHWGAECLLVSVTPAKAVDNLRMGGAQARGCPVVG